jgi:hypothetical protein
MLGKIFFLIHWPVTFYSPQLSLYKKLLRIQEMSDDSKRKGKERKGKERKSTTTRAKKLCAL